MQFINRIMYFTISFTNGDYKNTLLISIERGKSGASDYGDGSMHEVKVGAKLNALKEYAIYDTRYNEDIPHTKKEWIIYWLDWVIDNWGHNKDFEITFSPNDYNETIENY